MSENTIEHGRLFNVETQTFYEGDASPVPIQGLDLLRREIQKLIPKGTSETHTIDWQVSLPSTAVIGEAFHGIKLYKDLGNLFVICEGALKSEENEPHHEFTYTQGIDNESSHQIEPVLSLPSSSRITIPQPAEVQDYLLRYPDMREPVETVCRTAAGRFERQVQLSLEVYHDPEIKDVYLTLYVRQEQYDEQLLNEIDEVSAQCEALLVGKSGWLLVTTDFCSPT